MEWLTAPDQPAVRYLAMRDLLDASAGDLREARNAIPSRGWVKQMLEARQAGGFWGDREDLYRPKYLSTNWMLLALSDLGVTRELPGWPSPQRCGWTPSPGPTGASTRPAPRRASSASLGTPQEVW